MTPSRDLTRLLEIMAALRTPVSGCQWDLAQDFASIVPFMIEEAYEVADAVDRGDRTDLCDELGDLLLQVVFFARMAEEEGAFDFGNVVEAITGKLIRRHPHIFGSRRDLTPEQVRELWAAIKRSEKAARSARTKTSDAAEAGVPLGVLSEVGVGLPALTRATKLQAIAAKLGFDWVDPRDVLAKIREETQEAEAALGDDQALAEELGDLMFAVVNLARHAKVDPETALRAANRKFERRFGTIEQALVGAGRRWEDTTLVEMETLWTAAKQAEQVKASPPLTQDGQRPAAPQPGSDGGPAPTGPGEPLP